MVANVGGIDRVLRFIAGVVLILVQFVAPSVPALAGLGNWTWLIGALGVVMLLTAAFRFCPAYPLLGINTCGRG